MPARVENAMPAREENARQAREENARSARGDDARQAHYNACDCPHNGGCNELTKPIIFTDYEHCPGVDRNTGCLDVCWGSAGLLYVSF